MNATEEAQGSPEAEAEKAVEGTVDTAAGKAEEAPAKGADKTAKAKKKGKGKSKKKEKKAKKGKKGKKK